MTELTNGDNMNRVADAAARYYAGSGEKSVSEYRADVQLVLDWQARHMIRLGQQTLAAGLAKRIRDGEYPSLAALADGLHLMAETDAETIYGAEEEETND